MDEHLVLHIILLGIFQFSLGSQNNREHKVHNIVLYPDKHSWCEITPIKQEVTHPGCKSIEIDNNVCVGACFSYSIPKTEPEDPGEVQPYCDSCQPSDIRWKHVTLECEDNDYEDVMVKRIELIDNCTCSSCDTHLEKTLDKSTLLDKDRNSDMPELLSLMMKTHNSRVNPHNGSEPSNYSDFNELINDRVISAIRKLDESDDLLDLEVFKEMRKKFELEDHKFDHSSFLKFLKKIRSEQNVQVNSVRLLSVLESLEHHQNHSRHHQHHVHALGPHHSLVYPTYSQDIALDLYANSKEESLQSIDNLEPTLNVKPHHLKPAVEGTEIMYNDNANANINMIFSSKEEKYDERNDERNGAKDENIVLVEETIK